MTGHRPDIILITVDSLRADAIGAYGGPPTPTLDALAGESLLYEAAFATGSDTTHSVPGILASNYPTTGGSVQVFGARVSLAECLREAGYTTAAFHSNPLLSARRGYGRGFGTFYDSVGDVPPTAAGPDEGLGSRRARAAAATARHAPWLYGIARRLYRALLRRERPVEQPHEPAADINARARAWLAGAERPFLLWLHYMDPHWPYGTRLPGLSADEHRRALELAEMTMRRPERLSEDDLRRLRGLYQAEVAYLDGQLAELFAFLRAQGLWDGAALLFTSDHGQGFMEHGERFHGDLLYEELVRVPLLLKLPGVRPERHPGPASLIDLPPTVCAVAGVGPPATFEGRDLLTGPAREAVFAETAFRMFASERPRRAMVRTADWKLVADLERGRDELYALAEDPAERSNLARERPEELKRMRCLLEEHLARERPAMPDRPTDAVPAEESEAVKARLRALGYLDEAGE